MNVRTEETKCFVRTVIVNEMNEIRKCPRKARQQWMNLCHMPKAGWSTFAAFHPNVVIMLAKINNNNRLPSLGQQTRPFCVCVWKKGWSLLLLQLKTDPLVLLERVAEVENEQRQTPFGTHAAAKVSVDDDCEKRRRIACRWAVVYWASGIRWQTSWQRWQDFLLAQLCDATDVGDFNGIKPAKNK